MARVLFATFPLWSLGFLSWVPPLRFAIRRGRPADWAVFAGWLALTVVYGIMMWRIPENPVTESEETLSALGGGYALCMIVGGVAYALAGGGPWRPEPPGPFPGPPPPSGVLLPGPMDPPHHRPYGHGTPAPYHPGPAGPGPVAPGPATLPPAPPQSRPQPSAGPSPRMRQVADELDELGELLRKQEDDR
ncbi:DUF3824 domain-containing protein [Streptomyces aidingensis]|uniref:DUF3824 domain-containing protein n=1 Tax=Streptomyces aidingensis TaxID=910347 RepID=UPI001114918E|nr:DUF3824 domain-containing protein [Streptomyces aidingensis]